MADGFSGNYRFLARYNRWMNGKLYEASEALTDEARKQDRGAFFGSLHHTLNHLVVADQVWLKRFAKCGADNGMPFPSLGVMFALAGWIRDNFPGKILVMGGGLISSWMSRPDFVAYDWQGGTPALTPLSDLMPRRRSPGLQWALAYNIAQEYGVDAEGLSVLGTEEGASEKGGDALIRGSYQDLIIGITGELPVRLESGSAVSGPSANGQACETSTAVAAMARIKLKLLSRPCAMSPRSIFPATRSIPLRGAHSFPHAERPFLMNVVK